MPKEKMVESTSQDAIKEDGLRMEILKRFNRCTRHYADWETEAKEDYRFALGDQWTQEERDQLKEQSRPALTFNRIRPIINIVSGYQRENSSRIKVNPEGGEDRLFSEVMDRMIRAIDKWSHMSYKMGYWFDDGCFCGKGFLEAVLKYENDPIRGELDIKQRSPYQIMVDPDCIEYDLNDGAKYVFKIVPLSKDDLIALYPKKEKLIKGFVRDNDDIIENGSGMDGSPGVVADDDYGNDEQKRNYVKFIASVTDDEDFEKDGKFTIKEYWRKKTVDRYFLIDKESGEPKKFDKEEDGTQFAKEQGPIDGKETKVVKRMVPEMWVAAYCCGFILQDDKSPFEPYYSGYPFFRFMADWAPTAENEKYRVQGLTRALKDPQREKNKAKSQYLHIINTQANSGWIGDDNALTDTGWKALEKMGSKPGITVRKKPGTELREIQPKGPNQSHLVREEKADEEFTQISSVNPDLLGFQDGTTSGRAISMRIKQAVLALVRLFSNYQYSKEIIGKFLLSMVPMLFDEKKMIKVLGPEYMRTAVDKERYPEGLKEGHVAAFLQMVKDNKYDVYVTEADQNKTIRYETFQDLTELLKAGAPIPIDLLIEYMDLSNAQQVKDRIKEQQDAQLQAAAQGAPAAS